MSARRSAGRLHRRGGRVCAGFVGDNFRLRVEGRKGLGGHDGWVGDIMADFVLRDEGTYMFTIGPRARWGDNDYQDAYFGVTPGVAAVTVPVFDAGDGFYSVGVGLTYMLVATGVSTPMPATTGWSATPPFADRARSDRRDQFSGGIGLFYSFNAGNLFGG